MTKICIENILQNGTIADERASNYTYLNVPCHKYNAEFHFIYSVGWLVGWSYDWFNQSINQSINPNPNIDM